MSKLEIKTKLTLEENVTNPAKKAKSAIRDFGEGSERSLKKLKNTMSIVNASGVLFLAQGMGRLTIAAKDFGAQFIETAANMEQFQIQLEAITDSEVQAQRMFRTLREFARTSPLETEDVVQSFVRLRAVGIRPTMEQFKTLGSVALIFGQQMTDVLDGFVGMNKRTLRTLGIDIDRQGAKAIIQSGNVRKVVEKDSHSIRTALIETWGERFPDLLEKASKTTKARVAIMKSEFLELRDAIGKKLLPMTKAIVNSLGKMAKGLREGIEPTTELRLTRITKQMKELRTEISAAEQITKAGIGAGGLVQEMEAERVKELKKNYEELRKVKLKLILQRQIDKKGPGGTGQLGTEDEEAEKERLQKQKDADLKELERMDKRLRLYKRNEEKRLEAIRKYNEAKQALQDFYADIEQKKLDKQIKVQKKFVGEMTNLTIAMTDQLYQVISDENTKMRDILKSTLIMMLDFLAKKVIIAQVSAALDASIKSAGGLLAPAAITEAMAKIGAVNLLFSGAKAAVASFGDGTGPTQRPMVARVGERGPENMYLPAGTSITPNNSREGSQVVMNINVTGTLTREQGLATAYNLQEGLRDMERKGKLQRGLLL